MATVVPNQTPFLRQQRLLPQEMQALTVEIDRAYTDIAAAVNFRKMGVFTNNNSTQNGETWYQDGLSYQGFRRFYNFTAAGNIPHGLNLDNIFAFTNIYGTFTNGTIWTPIPAVSIVSAINQVRAQVDATNIIIAACAGAPVIVRGIIVLDWIGFS